MKKTLKKIKKMTVMVIMGVIAFSDASYANDEIKRVGSTPKQAFVLFYMASCSHCKRFDPVLREYAENHHMPVLAYTLDGENLPSFPQSVSPSEEEIHQFFPTDPPVVPALFLMDAQNHQIIPVLEGEANAQQLDERLSQLKEVIRVKRIDTEEIGADHEI